LAAIGEQVRGTVRHRYDEFMDDWHEGERHLPYTIIAVVAILVLGAIIVPITLSATRIEPTPEKQILAERYVDAISKVRGIAPGDIPTVAMAEKTFGTTGGDACTKPIPALHRQQVVHPKGSRHSFVDKVGVEQLRTTMRVYCPARDDRYAAWLTAQARA
jgi:hypothetical protein